MAAIFKRISMPNDQALVEVSTGMMRRQWTHFFGYITRMAEALAKVVGLTQERADFVASLTTISAQTIPEMEFDSVFAADIVAPLVEADVVLLANESKAVINQHAVALVELQENIRAMGEKFDRLVKSQPPAE